MDINPTTGKPFARTQQNLIDKFRARGNALPQGWYTAYATGTEKSAMRRLQHYGVVQHRWIEAVQDWEYALCQPSETPKDLSSSIGITQAYPEHAKYAMKQTQIEAVVSFLGSFDYGAERHIKLCEYHSDSHYAEYFEISLSERLKLIYAHFGVDYDKFMAEKNDMLEQVRAHTK